MDFLDIFVVISGEQRHFLIFVCVKIRRKKVDFLIVFLIVFEQCTYLLNDHNVFSSQWKKREGGPGRKEGGGRAHSWRT